MNYQNWSKRKFWGVLIGVFLLGVLLTPKHPVKEIEKTVTKEVPAQCDYTDWKELKAVDDIGLGYCATFADLASKSFEAISRFDTQRLSEITEEVNALSPKITELAERRQALLTKLGY